MKLGTLYVLVLQGYSIYRFTVVFDIPVFQTSYPVSSGIGQNIVSNYNTGIPPSPDVKLFVLLYAMSVSKMCV